MFRRLFPSSSLWPTLDRVPTEEGIYVVSVTVAGETTEGMPSERSFVRSLAVVRPETLHGEPTLLYK